MIRFKAIKICTIFINQSKLEFVKMSITNNAGIIEITICILSSVVKRFLIRNRLFCSNLYHRLLKFGIYFLFS